MSNYIFTIPESLDSERLMQIMSRTFSCCPIKLHLSQDAGFVTCMSTVFETGKCTYLYIFTETTKARDIRNG